MHITNLLVKSVLSSALTLSSLSIFAAASSEHTGHNEHQHHSGYHAMQNMADDHAQHTETADAVSHQPPPKLLHQQQALNTPQNSVSSASEHDHRKEHGAQIYSQIILDQKWQHSSEGNGAFKSKNQARVGTDENKIFLKLEADKHESRQAEYDAKVLYSRMISDFWDMQAGLGYQEHSLEVNQQHTMQERWNAVLGLHGLAPYFFETSAYLEVGQDDYVALNFEAERDLLLTQKLILQPYIEVAAILNDASTYTEKTGLHEAALGLNTRYEITKQVMPYVDIAYRYEQESQWENDQLSSNSEKDWVYGLGVKFRF